MNAAADPYQRPATPPSQDTGLPQAWDTDAGKLIVAGCTAIALALAAVMFWASLAPLSGSIVAMGMVQVDSHRKTVQHRDGGIVQDILVREGDHVIAGQALIVLDDKRIDASFDLTRSQLAAFRIKQSRLDAESELSAVWKPPAAYLARTDEPRIAEVLERESALFTARRTALDSQLHLIRQQIDEVAREVTAREREHASMRQGLAAMEEELSVNESLAAQDFINKTRILALKRDVAEYRIRMEDNQAEASQARQRGSDLRMKQTSLRETYVQEAATELRDTNAKIVDLEEQLRAASDASERKVITAPVTGRVVDLRVTTPGGAIGPRDPVLDIVPDDTPLLVEAQVGVDAISELHVGLSTHVRLTAYRQRTTPLIDGHVVYVSADSLATKDTGLPYYLVHVELDRQSLARAGEVDLRPGMAAEVFVRTRERSAFDYLLEPIVNAMRRSFREY